MTGIIVDDGQYGECQQCGEVDVLDIKQGSICYMCFLINGEEEE